MDVLGVELVAVLYPLIVGHVSFFAKSSFEVEGDEMSWDIPLGEPFTERRNDFAESAAFPGNVLGEFSHALRG